VAVTYDLGGKRVLVLGGSSGIGRAVGRLAARCGARVAFAARRRERLDEAAAGAGEGALALACDVRDAPSCADAVARAADAFGGLDALVYASGMSPLALLPDATAETWREILDVNVVGAALVTAAALPHLRASRGRAVYVSSFAVRQALPGLSLYRVSKVGLDALVECWRAEHPEVEFTRVVLGNTAGTGFADAWSPDALREALRIWNERRLFPNATLMPLDVAAEALVSVLAVRGYVDDLAVLPRAGDASAEGT